jgi:hypothetical protein
MNPPDREPRTGSCVPPPRDQPAYERFREPMRSRAPDVDHPAFQILWRPWPPLGKPHLSAAYGVPDLRDGGANVHARTRRQEENIHAG